MILNENLYRNLINTRKAKYDNLAQERFKEINQNVELLVLSEQASLLHQLQLSGMPYREEDFSKEIHQEVKDCIIKVEENFKNGTFKTPVFTKEELVEIFYVSQEEIESCFQEGIDG